jgi:putative endonuclease
MRNHIYYVYIITNKHNTVLYIGVTSDISGRIYQHKHKLIKGFSSRYNIYKLVYYEHFNSIFQAIEREKQLKKWRRQWKIELIEKMNPDWRDLSQDIWN